MPSVTARAQISIMNFIKSPKKWSGQNRTSQTDPAPTPMCMNIEGFLLSTYSQKSVADPEGFFLLTHMSNAGLRN